MGGGGSFVLMKFTGFMLLLANISLPVKMWREKFKNGVAQSLMLGPAFKNTFINDLDEGIK